MRRLLAFLIVVTAFAAIGALIVFPVVGIWVIAGIGGAILIWVLTTLVENFLPQPIFPKVKKDSRETDF